MSFYSRHHAVKTTPVSSVTVVKEYPHDATSFTQGLVFTANGNNYYESSGLYGKSELREVELSTGRTIRSYKLPSTQFAEGVTLYKGKVVQLTWKEHVALVYDPLTFTNGPVSTFQWPREGWGITTNGEQLIISDGSSSLYILSANTPYAVQKVLPVKAWMNGKLQSVSLLNELEWVKGEIYANIWKEKRIAVINPSTGVVRKYLDLSSLPSPSSNSEAVLNGFAYIPSSNKLVVTGKLWPVLYEIKAD